MEVETQFVEENRPNVIGRLKSGTSRRHILLGPHLDTVSVAGMTIDPFAGSIKDGKIWGRGASDAKGPIAAILVALSLLVQERRHTGHTDIWFIGLMGEESANRGIAYLMESDFFVKKGVKFDFGIAGEPTDLKIVYRHKGALWLKIRTRGKSCHAACPELGENAILKIRRAMDFTTQELSQAYAHLEDDLLGRPTFSLTTIRGGSKVNIIPDFCEMEVDHRSVPRQSHAEVVKRIREALPECEVEIISDCPPMDTPVDNPYIQKLADVLQRHAPGTERNAFFAGAPWYADCSLMSRKGIPAIAFGPGSGNQAHTKDEYVEVAELEKGVEVFHKFLVSLA